MFIQINSMSAFISLFNDKHHVRIVNNNTKVVSYMLKSNLIIQKDNDSTFFLKNDSYVKYIKYDDVLTPSTSNLNQLLQVVIDYMVVDDVSNQIISVNEMEKADIVLDVNVYSGKNEHLISESAINNATSTHESNYVCMKMNTVDAGAQNKLIRQSKEYANVPSGRINISLITGILAKTSDNSAIDVSAVGDTVGDNVTSQIGIFDDNNGIYFQYEASNTAGDLVETYSICKTVNSTTVTIEQSNWNIDTCDGNGSSGIVFSKSDMNTFIFRTGTLPKTFLQVGIMHEGNAILIHDFKNEQFFNKLPMRWSLTQTCGAENVSKIEMVQNNSVILSNEKHHIQKTHKSAICPADSHYKKLNSDAVEDVIFDIKLNSTYQRSKIKIEKINIINKESTGIVLWKLVKNAIIVEHNGGVVPTHTQSSIADVLSESSSQSYDGSGNVILTNYLKIDPSNPGTIISSGYIVNNVLTEIDLSSDTNVIYSDINGVSDHLTLVAHYVNAPAEVQATVTWIQYE